MLEESDTGDIDGIGSVKAAVGLKRPFFSYRVVNNASSSPSLNIRMEHQTLVLVNECTGWTEVGSLFLKADRRKGGAGRLLSQSRYMLIGAEPELFADTVLAELRGVFTPDGACPFWDHVAHKFFPMPFDQADMMTGSTDKQFILDLAPRHPIYVDLLPEPARAVIGKVHPARRAGHGPAGKRGLPPQRPDRHLRRGPDRRLRPRQHPHRPRRPLHDRRHRRRGRGRTAVPDLDQQRRRLPRGAPACRSGRRRRHRLD
jgi:arginine N-succinyltransferase